MTTVPEKEENHFDKRSNWRQKIYDVYRDIKYVTPGQSDMRFGRIVYGNFGEGKKTWAASIRELQIWK